MRNLTREEAITRGSTPVKPRLHSRNDHHRQSQTKPRENKILRLAAIVVGIVILCSGSAWGEEWIKKTAEKNGFTLQLAFWTNASNQLSDNGTGFTHHPPLIIHSTAKYTGKPKWGHCDEGFLHIFDGCFTCPPGFDENLLPEPSDQEKCVKFYDPVDSFDEVYDRSLVEAAGFTKRQIKCVFDVESCYTGIIGALGGERYGVSCGWNFGGATSNLTDNIDKCCYAHDMDFWKYNMNLEQGNENCANDLNFLRCVNKVLTGSGISFTDAAGDAAQWIKNALNLPVGALCQSDWNTNDGGNYPWSASDCNNPANCYSHRFENQAWYDNLKKPVTWCDKGYEYVEKRKPPCKPLG